MGVDVHELGGAGEAASGRAGHSRLHGAVLHHGFLGPAVGG